VIINSSRVTFERIEAAAIFIDLLSPEIILMVLKLLTSNFSFPSINEMSGLFLKLKIISFIASLVADKGFLFSTSSTVLKTIFVSKAFSIIIEYAFFL